MKPEQQRIAIAEACGWRWESPFNESREMNILVSPSNKSIIVWRDGSIGGERHIPDYLKDLNAMHEAEETLSNEQWEYAYESYLSKITFERLKNSPIEMYRGVNHRRLIQSATAAQRAEAFLRALNLWIP